VYFFFSPEEPPPRPYSLSERAADAIEMLRCLLNCASSCSSGAYPCDCIKSPPSSAFFVPSVRLAVPPGEDNKGTMDDMRERLDQR